MIVTIIVKDGEPVFDLSKMGDHSAGILFTADI